MYYVNKASGGNGHACAALQGSTAMCWGSNYSGELGLGTTDSNIHSPAPVTVVSSILDIKASSGFTCALLTDSSVQCWGNLSAEGSSATPYGVGFANTTALSAGDTHICALFADTTMRCLGDGTSGQTGDATVTALTGVTGIAAGGFHTCAVVKGNVMCWGSNQQGQLGNGTFTDSQSAVLVR